MVRYNVNSQRFFSGRETQEQHLLGIHTIFLITQESFMAQEERFQNLDPTPESRGNFLDVARFMLGERRRTRALEKITPPKPTPAVSNDGAALRENTTRTSITWIGHSSFVLQIGGRTILTDPVWSKTSGAGPFGPTRMVPPGVRLADLPPVDLVLISHNHYDHLDYSTIRWLGNKPTYLVPSRLGGWFHALGCQKVHECGWWDELELLGLHFDFVPSQHWSKRTLTDNNKTLWGGWMVSDGSQKLYFAGDSGYFSGFKLIGERYPGIDIAFLPIGAYEPRWFMQSAHVNPEEAGQAFLDVGARIIVPMHWGTFRLSTEPTDEPSKRLAAWWDQHGFDPANNWTLAVGETRFFEKS
jgi:L-ascorbate metabolism protein UlaG (beta-lactamase superfamily)